MIDKKHTRIAAFVVALTLAGGGALASDDPGQYAPGQDYVKGSIRVSHPWTPPTSESAKDAPGYLTITNTGSTPDRLKSGSFVESAHLQFHSTVGKTSEQIDGITINPGETVTLKPGGNYIKFIDLQSSLERGTSLQGILGFEQAGSLVIEFMVEGPAKAAPRTASKRRPSREAEAR